MEEYDEITERCRAEEISNCFAHRSIMSLFSGYFTYIYADICFVHGMILKFCMREKIKSENSITVVEKSF